MFSHEDEASTNVVLDATDSLGGLSRHSVSPVCTHGVTGLGLWVLYNAVKIAYVN